MTRSLLFIFFAISMLSACNLKPEEGTSGTFSFEMHFTYPGEPEFVYDHLTGDIGAWWVHSFSENPYRLYIESKYNEE